jgi:hypothetical protein
VIGGPKGAAAKLGLKRTTLISKMLKLGIGKPILQSNSDLRQPACSDPDAVPQVQ